MTTAYLIITIYLFILAAIGSAESLVADKPPKAITKTTSLFCLIASVILVVWAVFILF